MLASKFMVRKSQMNYKRTLNTIEIHTGRKKEITLPLLSIYKKKKKIKLLGTQNCNEPEW